MAVTTLSSLQPTGFPQTATLPAGVLVYEWSAGATGDTGAALDAAAADDITLTLEGTVTSVTWQVSNENTPTVWVPLIVEGTAATVLTADKAGAWHINGRYRWLRPSYTTGSAIIARAVLTMSGR